jgi:asparagine synthase (glutamine-hydrolysing)
LPESLRAEGGQRKILLRRLARELLPPAFDVTRKQGFTPPLASWFQDQWKGRLAEVLTGAAASVFEPAAVRALLDGESRGRVNSQRLFALLMFELWRREYRIEVP